MGTRLSLTGVLLLCIAMGSGLSLAIAQTTTPQVIVQFDQVVSVGPQVYGTNGWWTDQDAAIWQARYAGLHSSVIRLAMSHSTLEPNNDNDDPAQVNWDGFLFDEPISITGGRTGTYSLWLAMLRDQGVTLLIHFPYLAPWLSRNSPHSGGVAPYPPNDLDEYQEFIEVVLHYLIDQVGFPPERILLEVMNEPDLRCGVDPVTPCFWQNWTINDIRDVVRVTEQAVQSVAPTVRLVGLAECCGTAVVRDLLDHYPEGSYLDALSYHYYDPSSSGPDLAPALSRAGELAPYGLPIYLDEYGSRYYRSEGIEGGLWHSYALPTWWEAGIGPVQYPISEWPLLGEPYNSMGLFRDWEGDWAYKPSYWVYANFYRRVGGTDVVSHTVTTDLEVMAGRDKTGGSRLILWVTNPLGTPQPDTLFEIRSFPVTETTVSVYDNLQSTEAITTFVASGEPLRFSYDIPGQSSLSFELWQTPATPTPTPTPTPAASPSVFTYLPLIFKDYTSE